METRLWCTFSYNINYTLFSFLIYVYLIISKIQQIINIIFKKKTEGKKAFFFLCPKYLSSKSPRFITVMVMLPGAQKIPGLVHEFSNQALGCLTASAVVGESPISTQLLWPNSAIIPAHVSPSFS